MKPHVIAVDWSGSKTRAEKKIWLAEVNPTTMQVVRLEAERDRETLTQHLVEHAAKDPNFIVGFDFAFSMPAWFLKREKLENAAALWDAAVREGEDWLSKCDEPFWGRPGKGRPKQGAPFRRTEDGVRAVNGIRPKSVFQIGGAGAVGTGSIRGMPTLAKLAANRFSVWPFTAGALPLVVEIYPRALTGKVDKSNKNSRRKYLDRNFPGIDNAIRDAGCSCDDAFDALVSALVMARHIDELMALAQISDETTQLEGQIWLPDSISETQ